MATSDPGAWEFLCPIPGTRASAAGPARAVVKAGTVEAPDWMGPRIALQVDDDPVVILPPAAAAALIGALQRGLREVSMLPPARR